MSDIKEKSADFVKKNIVTLVFSILCVISIGYSGQNANFILQEIITRICRNSVLILSLLMPVLCGMGLNFSIVLGAAAGQIGLIVITHYGMGGFGGMTVCLLIATAFSVLFGWFAGAIFNRTVGQEMITGMIIGYFSKGIFDLFFLVLVGSALIPIVNPVLVLSTGVGLKNTIELNDNVKYVFDNVLKMTFRDTLVMAMAVFAVLALAVMIRARVARKCTAREAAARARIFIGGLAGCALLYLIFTVISPLSAAADYAKVPVFTCILIGLVCLFTVYISKTKLGQDIRTCGQNMQVASSAGIRVGKVRIVAIILSTIVASWGQVIFLQNMGLINTYTSHEQVGTYAVAALLVGGASVRKANIGQAFLGAFLFHMLFFTMPLAGKNMFHDAQIGEYFRVFISYGVIAVSLALYVWNQAADRKKALKRVSQGKLAGEEQGKN